MWGQVLQSHIPFSLFNDPFYPPARCRVMDVEIATDLRFNSERTSHDQTLRQKLYDCKTRPHITRYHAKQGEVQNIIDLTKRQLLCENSNILLLPFPVEA